MSEPRAHLYRFAHRILPYDAHTEPKLWSFITGDKAHSYLQMRWYDAEAPEPPTGLMWVEPVHIGGLEIVLLRMPDSQAPTEPYFAAFVRGSGPALRYFVLERSSAGGAFWAEWKPEMRIRGGDVAEWPADFAKRQAMPYPYAATFVEAIVAEAGVKSRKPPVAAIAIVALLAIGIGLYIWKTTSNPPPPVTAAPAIITPDAALVVEAPPVDAVSSAPTGGFAELAAKPKRKAPAKVKPASIEPAAIQAVVRRNFGRMRLCYENALRQNATLRGTVKVTFTIDAAGKATDIQVAGMPELDACVAKAFAALVFPAGPQRIVYPIVFEPSG